MVRESLVALGLSRDDQPITWKTFYENCTLRIADVKNGGVEINSGQVDGCMYFFNFRQPHVHFKEKVVA